MTATITRWLCSLAMTALVGGMVLAAPPRPLTDSQLDAVYAAGFNVQVDLGLDLAATNPDAVFITGGAGGAAGQLLDQGVTLTRTTGGGMNTATVDPVSGVYSPNLQNLTVNNINISNEALQNATSLMNIFALEGDIAVGMNLNVVVNPIDSIFTVNQMNINMSNLGLSNAFTTLFPSGN